MANRMGTHMSGAPTSGGTQQGQGATRGNGGAVPFVRATVEHTEPTGYDITTQLGTAAITLPDIVVPAYGFLRAIKIVVTTASGAGAAVFSQDAPFNVLQNIILQEPNGAQICNFPSGYDLYLANKFGGYWHGNDPRISGNQTFNLTGGLFSFVLRIPIEANLRDAVGSLPNQNSGAQFRVKMNLAAAASGAGSGTPYTTQPATTFPTVRVRAFAEEWDQPEDSTDGRKNQTTPPALNTTQYWSRQDFPVNAGQNQIRLTRVGNLIRNLIFVYRDAANAQRTLDASFPDPATLYYDTRPLDIVSRALWIDRIYERYGYGAQMGNTNSAAGTALALDSGNGREASVFPMDFCHEFGGFVGRELRDLWLPTLSSTRLEIQGTFAAGTLTVLTNDVTIADNVWL